MKDLPLSRREPETAYTTYDSGRTSSVGEKYLACLLIVRRLERLQLLAVHSRDGLVREVFGVVIAVHLCRMVDLSP